MSTEELRTDAQHEDNGMQQDTPTGPGTNRKRPRIDLTLEPRERKRGKTMFGLVLGTLNKARTEDKERNASDAAKKRQLIEQRLQDKLRKETDSVRRAEEAKKDKTSANRKEEELQLKDSIHKLRRKRLPVLANFLSTADRIPSSLEDIDSQTPMSTLLAQHPRSHPPSLYYLPAILTPAQDAFLKRRKAEVQEAAEKEWESFKEERKTGIEEITQLRQRVAEEEARKKSEQQTTTSEQPSQSQQESNRDADGGGAGEDVKMAETESPSKEAPASEPTSAPAPGPTESQPPPTTNGDKPAEADKKDEEEDGPPGLSPPKENLAMDVDDNAAKVAKVEEKAKSGSASPRKETLAATAPAAAATDEDDAVEY
ncbi:unnamed protein product [Somion occarium]|uniref:Pinin/SDK/MemA protein domain-containing protein n=1 Tax=Somion occarium TaxID=3059160 RepID=A0ABP1DXR3_9APHY